MTPETILVLRHWRENWDKACDGTLEDIDIDSSKCAYCGSRKESCTNCPVSIEVGKVKDLQIFETPCNYTPWLSVSCRINIGPELLKSAVWAELQFLLGIAWKELGQPTSGGCKEKVGPGGPEGSI